MRRTPNLLRNILFLCLPTIAVVVLSVRFAVTELPRLAADERARVEALRETESRELLADPSLADFVWERGKGVVRGASVFAERFPAALTWKDWPSKGRAKTKEKWGVAESPAGTLVWIRDTADGGDPNRVYGRRSSVVARSSVSLFAGLGAFALVVLIVTTIAGVRFFVLSVRSRDDFMAAAAHDLTTPLVGMRLAIGRDDVEARRLNERLLRLVENVKDFLRLGGRRAPRCETFDLKRAYDEAYALFRDDYRDLLGADVAVALPDGCPGGLAVRADETMTVQILWNLLGNDLKYAAPYGGVRVVFRREAKTVAVDFIDTGKGMTPRERRRAFDRYYRAKTVLESGKGGFGIGLCTAREFAEAMGGTLTVRANVPKGCVFTLILPGGESP